MNFENIIPDKAISLFVKNIWVFENADENSTACLPFFADGFPGLIFQQTDNGLIVQPHNKTMPPLFLYGQTIQPIQLEVSGKYLIIIFQLYPFVLRTFFNILPQTINDNCYYLEESEERMAELHQQLLAGNTLQHKIATISALLLYYFEKKRQNLDFKIRQAVVSIMHTKGQEKIHALAGQLHINIRTLERRFLTETGLTPKQFANIIRFQSSLEQLNVKDFSKLTDVVFQHGFSDQSHFIKVFKAFTGKTPKTLHR